MFSQLRIRPALLSTLVVLLLLMGAGAPDAGVSQATTASGDEPANVAALPCQLITPFNASNFSNPTNINNPWFPLVPGTKFVLDGRVNVGGQPLSHQVILIVTDLTKVVNGVRTVVLWDRDFNTGVLTESELAFHAQDNAGNIWNFGEYPAEYSGGHFTEAPDTWFSGLSKGKAGTVVLGDPHTGTPIFLQAYAPNIIGDCGQVASVGQQNPPLCVPTGCYNNVLVIDETSPGEPGTQQKYYAPGVGNFKVGATDNDPQGETLVLSETVRLGRSECIAARQAALALEDQAYHHDTTQSVYKKTTPMQQTGYCESLGSTATPTRTASPTPSQPTPTPRNRLYMPYIARSRPTPTSTPLPTPTPTVPPAIFDGCQSDPNPASAPNYPIRIVNVNKITEVVTLQNVSSAIVSVEDWNMCSLNGNQEHDDIFGTLGPGQVRNFPNVGGSLIWDDNQRDDGALYNAAGYIVSYWVDQ